MGLTVAVVCAVYGDYDGVVEPPFGFDDAVLVSDRTHDVEGWRQVVWPQPGRHPRLAAKVAKCRPDWFTGCDASVWIDGNMRPTGGDLRGAAETHLGAGDLVLWRHPEGRDCITQEARYCADWSKYSGYPVVAQADEYIAAGMPAHHGLYCCNLIARLHTWRTAELGSAWLGENETWSIQDQVSMPYLLWQRSWEPVTWDAPYATNPWVRWAAHSSDR
jgi:hypothetical protein